VPEGEEGQAKEQARPEEQVMASSGVVVDAFAVWFSPSEITDFARSAGTASAVPSNQCPKAKKKSRKSRKARH
jgi:hypothetical protein